MAAELEKRRILVTGVDDYAGAELVRELEQSDGVEHIAALDFREPRRVFDRAELITLDLRSGALKRMLEAIRPDTVLHLQRLRSDQDASSAEEMHEINVMG